jgi:DNA-nicking Smr family endonuclease
MTQREARAALDALLDQAFEENREVLAAMS